MSDAAVAGGVTRGSGISASPREAAQLRIEASEDDATQQFANPSDDLMVDAQMNLLAALRDNGIRNLQVCFRAVPQPPTPDSINALVLMINNLAEHGR